MRVATTNNLNCVVLLVQRFKFSAAHTQYMDEYAELWALAAALVSIFCIPLIEITYRVEVQARVVMVPIEKKNTRVANAYEDRSKSK